MIDNNRGLIQLSIGMREILARLDDILPNSMAAIHLQSAIDALESDIEAGKPVGPWAPL